MSEWKSLGNNLDKPMTDAQRRRQAKKFEKIKYMPRPTEKELIKEGDEEYIRKGWETLKLLEQYEAGKVNLMPKKVEKLKKEAKKFQKFMGKE